MKILVTGCAGFIGSNFVRRLLKQDSKLEIINVDALTYAGNLSNIADILDHPRHRFVKGDLRDAALIERLVEPDLDMVINFAAESHVDRSIEGPKAFIDSNINGTFNLLEAVRKTRKPMRFVQVSTDEVYGSLGETGLFREDSPLRPSSPYSASKAAADLWVNAYGHTYKMDFVITRCSNNYGPYQFPEKLIPLMTLNATQGKKLPIYGTGKNVRDWIHVWDHCDGIWLAATRGRSGEVYNFGANTERTNLEIVREILQVLGKPETLIEYVTDRPGHDWRYAIDSSKVQNELGWTPQVSFADGLKNTIHWYLEHKDWAHKVQSGEYRAENERLLRTVKN